MTLADRRPLTNAYEPSLPAVRRRSICGAGLGFGPQSSQTGSKLEITFCVQGVNIPPCDKFRGRTLEPLPLAHGIDSGTLFSRAPLPVRVFIRIPGNDDGSSYLQTEVDGRVRRSEKRHAFSGTVSDVNGICSR